MTGAGSGVGRALASALAAEGAAVALLGRTASKLEATAVAFPATAHRPHTYVVDLADDGAVQDVARRLVRDMGRVDLLIHSAGVISTAPVERASLNDFDVQYRVNVRAPFLLTQLLLPELEQSQGQVVFLNSTAGLNASAGASQYAASKHALKAVADSLRDEVNARGIRVLSVFLGRTATPMQEALAAAEGTPYEPQRLIQPGDVARLVLDVLALPRTVEVTNITLRPMVKP